MIRLAVELGGRLDRLVRSLASASDIETMQVDLTHTKRTIPVWLNTKIRPTVPVPERAGAFRAARESADEDAITAAEDVADLTVTTDPIGGLTVVQGSAYLEAQAKRSRVLDKPVGAPQESEAAPEASARHPSRSLLHRLLAASARANWPAASGRQRPATAVSRIRSPRRDGQVRDQPGDQRQRRQAGPGYGGEDRGGPADLRAGRAGMTLSAGRALFPDILIPIEEYAERRGQSVRTGRRDAARA